MEINTKAEFFRMWHQGLLGNRTRLTQDPDEAWNWKSEEYGFRMAPCGGGGGAWAGVPRSQFWTTYNEWKYSEKQTGFSFYIDDRVPDSYQTIQGEICRTHRGLEGYIGASLFPMRVAMAQGILKPRSSIETLVLLNSYMDPSSRDDVDAIFDLFPDATIEFTCFKCPVGVLRRNTMFWEVRNY
jgi:hypothetical protein